MPKPSEIFNTPEADSRVGGNEEQRQEFGLLFAASLSYDQQLLEAIWDWHLTTKDQEKEEAEKRIEEYLRQLVHTLHKEFCFTGLATEEQWNEGVSPKLKALANVIRGYSPDSPTARVYKFPALPTEDNK